MNTLVPLCINQHTKSEVPSFNDCKDMFGVKIKKTDHVTLTMLIRGSLSSQRLTVDIFYLHTKFGDSRFSHSSDIIVGMKTENGSCNLTMPLLRVVCHPIVYLCANFDNSSFGRSRDIIGNLKIYVNLTVPLLRIIFVHMLGLDVAYLCTKFDHSSFNRSRDMNDAQ